MLLKLVVLTDNTKVYQHVPLKCIFRLSSFDHLTRQILNRFKFMKFTVDILGLKVMNLMFLGHFND